MLQTFRMKKFCTNPPTRKNSLEAEFDQFMKSWNIQFPTTSSNKTNPLRRYLPVSISKTRFFRAWSM